MSGQRELETDEAPRIRSRTSRSIARLRSVSMDAYPLWRSRLLFLVGTGAPRTVEDLTNGLQGPGAGGPPAGTIDAPR